MKFTISKFLDITDEDDELFILRSDKDYECEDVQQYFEKRFGDRVSIGKSTLFSCQWYLVPMDNETLAIIKLMFPYKQQEPILK